MNKFGYAALLIVIAALAVYSLWPSGPTKAERLVSEATAPKAFTLRARGLEQRAEGDRVTLIRNDKPLNRELDNQLVQRLWSALRSVSIDPKKQLNEIGEKEAAAYGLDGGRELIASDNSVRLRWGGDDKTGYVWNGVTRRMVPVPPMLVAQLDQSADRLDKRVLIDLLPSFGPDAMMGQRKELARMVVNGLDVTQQSFQWMAPMEPQRPPFSSRVSQVVRLLSQLNLDTFDHTPTALLPVAGVIGISDKPEIGPAHNNLTLYRQGELLLAVYNDLPAQLIGREPGRQLLAALDAFKTDQLVEVDRTINLEYLEKATVTRGGERWFELIRTSRNLVSEVSVWDLVWPGGRERAMDGTGDKLKDLFASLVTTNTTSDAATAPKPGPQAITITLLHHRSGETSITIDGSEARFGAYRGTLVRGEVLTQAVQPEKFLDRRLTRRSGDRVVKVQRIRRDATPSQGEVYARAEGGSWRRTHPEGADSTDPAAIDRLVRALCLAQVSDVKLEESGQQRTLDGATIDIDLRFAAVPMGEAGTREVDLDETLQIDWGISLKRDADRWIGVDKELGRRFTLDDETMEELLRPVERGLVFPVLPGIALSGSIITNDAPPVQLNRAGEGWTVTPGNDPAKPADAVAVRRWFRDLGNLRGTVNDKAAEPTPKDVAATITVKVPGLNRDTETLTLRIMGSDGGGTAVYVASDKAVSRFPRGRAVVDSTLLKTCLAPAEGFSAR